LPCKVIHESLTITIGELLKLNIFETCGLTESRTFDDRDSVTSAPPTGALKHNLAEQIVYVVEVRWILKSSLIIVTESETV